MLFLLFFLSSCSFLNFRDRSVSQHHTFTFLSLQPLGSYEKVFSSERDVRKIHGVSSRKKKRNLNHLFSSRRWFSRRRILAQVFCEKGRTDCDVDIPHLLVWQDWGLLDRTKNLVQKERFDWAKKMLPQLLSVLGENSIVMQQSFLGLQKIKKFTQDLVRGEPLNEQLLGEFKKSLEMRLQREWVSVSNKPYGFYLQSTLSSALQARRESLQREWMESSLEAFSDWFGKGLDGQIFALFSDVYNDLKGFQILKDVFPSVERAFFEELVERFQAHLEIREKLFQSVWFAFNRLRTNLEKQALELKLLTYQGQTHESLESFLSSFCAHLSEPQFLIGSGKVPWHKS